MNRADLNGRVCLVTGANAGIGRVTALELARSGARVILACRSEEKTRPVIEQIRRDTGNDAVEFLQLDLANLAATKNAAEEFLRRDMPLHVLVNNAGLAAHRGVTDDGFEIQFGVNQLGHFLFTTLLLDKLRESAPARIVIVASHAHYKAKTFDFTSLRKPTKTLFGYTEYAVSKAANILFASELARRLNSSGVTVYSLHPGVVATDIWRRIPWPVRPLVNRFLLSCEDGAKTSLYCATAPELVTETGRYYDEHCNEKKPSRLVRDADLAKELWSRSEAWCS